MDTLQAIQTRRSIRKYRKEAVQNDLLEICLRAAMYAPSARNTQSWQFVVIDDRDKLDRIAGFHPYAGMLHTAPLAIAVCGDLKLEPSTEYNALNCSAATQNILLAANDLGLGSVWLGIYPRQQRMQDLKDLLRLPDHIVPVSLIVLGYPDEEKESPERFRADRIHLNSW